MYYTTKKLSSQPTGGRYIAISCSCRTTNAYEKEKDKKPERPNEETGRHDGL